MDLKNLLRDYVYDTNNPDLCFKIGTHYRNIKQYASAITFFLKASELFNKNICCNTSIKS